MNTFIIYIYTKTVTLSNITFCSFKNTVDDHIIKTNGSQSLKIYIIIIMQIDKTNK